MPFLAGEGKVGDRRQLIFEMRLWSKNYPFNCDSGVEFAASLDDCYVGSLIPFETPHGDEYLVGFHNFFVITRYNRSVMYALAAHQLGQSIADKVDAHAG